MDNNIKFYNIEKYGMYVDVSGTTQYTKLFNEEEQLLLTAYPAQASLQVRAISRDKIIISGKGPIEVFVPQFADRFTIELSGDIYATIGGGSLDSSVYIYAYDKCRIEARYLTEDANFFLYDDASLALKGHCEKINLYNYAKARAYYEFKEAELFDYSHLTAHQSFDKVTANNNSILEYKPGEFLRMADIKVNDNATLIEDN